MNILITGGTGFLGKSFLRMVENHPKVDKIILTTRQNITHPNPKVKILQLDLSMRSSVDLIPQDVNHVFHFAGHYRFGSEFSENYLNNVLPALHLVDAFKGHKNPPIFHIASTYAVCCTPQNKTIHEDRIQRWPQRKTLPYARSKAMAEEIFLDSQLPVRCFRLGILVGDTEYGQIEKIDGPYYFLRFLNRIKSARLSQTAPFIPVPGVTWGVLPLVPVDSAARVFLKSMLTPQGIDKKIYGVFHPDSVRLDTFCTQAIDHILPGQSPVFFRKIPSSILTGQQKLTGIPGEAFRFSMSTRPFKNANFSTDFPQCSVPSFRKYREKLFQGYQNFIDGRFL